MTRFLRQFASLDLKKWSDDFRIDLLGNPLPADARRLLPAAAVFVDLQYFEKKAR